SSTAGGGSGAGMVGVTTGVVGGVGSLVVVVGFPPAGTATGVPLSTTVATGGTTGSVGVVPASFRASRWAATKANAFVGASISAQSPLTLRAFTASPLCNMPTTL